jgi:hypothetical protein
LRVFCGEKKDFGEILGGGFLELLVKIVLDYFKNTILPMKNRVNSTNLLPK